MVLVRFEFFAYYHMSGKMLEATKASKDRLKRGTRGVEGDYYIDRYVLLFCYVYGPSID